MSLIDDILSLRGGLVVPNTNVQWDPPPKTKPISVDSRDIKVYGPNEIPIPAYQFSFEVDGRVVALFQKFGGMRVERAVEPYTEGGMNERTLEFPGQISYAHVTLESGLCSSNFFWDWMKAGQYAGLAYTKNFTLAQRRPSSKTDEYWEVVREWFFINAFPVAWEVSDLSVDDDSSIAVETLELTFDYFELYTS
jgi:phage tail-like protein